MHSAECGTRIFNFTTFKNRRSRILRLRVSWFYVNGGYGVKKRYFSLGVRLSLWLLVLFFPALFVVIGANIYASRDNQTQLLQGHQQMAERYVAQFDDMRRSIEKTVQAFAVSSKSPDNLQYHPNETTRAFASVEIRDWMTTSVMYQYPDLRMGFVYSAQSKDYITAFGEDSSFQQREVDRQWVRQSLQEELFPNNKWSWQTWEGGEAMVFVYRVDALYYGVLLPVDGLAQAMKEGRTDAVFCLLENGMPVQGGQSLQQIGLVMTEHAAYQRVLGQNYMIIPAALADGVFTAVKVSETEPAFGQLTRTQILFLVVAGLMSVIFLVLYVLLYRTVIRPVSVLMQAMDCVARGDLGYRVEAARGAREFHVIGATFNQMMEHIQQLTRDVYERELENQKARLRNLQLQINPHFLSNCLNVIYAASVPQNWDVVREMSKYLISYFRFMNKLDGSSVTLGEELHYTKDFLHIQELRFPEHFSWSIEAPDYLAQARIPPLVIKTFAENTLKHAVQGNSFVELQIEAAMEPGEERTALRLCIRDTGPGFPAEVLEKFRTQTPQSDDGQHHIGLDNIRRQLELTYGLQAMLELENLPQGGCAVHIRIPLDL